MTAVAKTAQAAPVASIRRREPGPIFEARAEKLIGVRPGAAITVDGIERLFTEWTPLVMPALEPGRDYYVKRAGDGFAVEIALSTNLDEVLGGFHFALGSNAPARAGGDDRPLINPFSIWDIGFRPACADPRGMAFVAGIPGSEHVPAFWADIYLLNINHLTAGTSVAGAPIADGDEHRPAKAEGGRVGKLDYATAAAIMAGHGKGLLSIGEFFAAAYGVTEKTAAGKKPLFAGLDPARTSRVGLMQATGNLYIWGHDGDPDEPRASFFGGYWGNDEFAGSRRAFVDRWPGHSLGWFGARGRSDHLNLE